MIGQRGLLVALAALSLAGCGTTPPRVTEASPSFVFRALKLRHQDDRGRTGWELSSPEARYDVRRRLARAIRPLGVIHAHGAPRYRLSAQTGTVLNDGQVILLEGEARIERLGPEPVLIQGRRLRWIPARSEVLIDRGPQARMGPYRLVAQTATLLTGDDRLDLAGRPQLQRWPAGGRIGQGEPEMALNTQALRWHPGSGALVASGPIALVRRPPERSPQQPVQRLEATGLKGNTTQQWLELGAPVRLRDPVDGLDLSLGSVRLNLIEQTATSADPFRGSMARAQLSGQGLDLALTSHWLTISQACQLQRPDVHLQARRCRWNWHNQSFAASGGVRLLDPRRGSTTSSEQLEGELGDGSVLRFSSPGGRVVSWLPLAQPR